MTWRQERRPLSALDHRRSSAPPPRQHRTPNPRATTAQERTGGRRGVTSTSAAGGRRAARPPQRSGLAALPGLWSPLVVVVVCRRADLCVCVLCTRLPLALPPSALAAPCSALPPGTHCSRLAPPTQQQQRTGRTTEENRGGRQQLHDGTGARDGRSGGNGHSDSDRRAAVRCQLVSDAERSEEGATLPFCQQRADGRRIQIRATLRAHRSSDHRCCS